MWYEKAYFNHRDWILDNLKTLKLSPVQTVVTLMIDYLLMQGEAVSVEILSELTGISLHDVDEAIQVLVARRALKINIDNAKVVFDLSGLFDSLLYEYVDDNVFSIFETEFSRVLSQKELETLNGWLKMYPKAWVLDALRKASIQDKLKFNYINGILLAMKRDEQHDDG